MFLVLKDRYTFLRHDLTEESVFNWKGISVYPAKGVYYVSLKDGYRFADQTKLKKLELKEYEIVTGDKLYSLHLYVYEDGKGIDDYSLYRRRDLIWSASSKADLVSSDPYLKDGYLIIRNNQLSANIDVSLNGLNCGTGQLSSGDVIEYLGLRIICYDEYLYINSFRCQNRLERYEANELRIRYPSVKERTGFQIPEKRQELEIDEVREFPKTEKLKFSDFIRSFLPNLVMSVSISLMAYLNYINSLNSSYSTPALTYLIMPAGMFMTGAMIPSVFYLIDTCRNRKQFRETRKEYLAYLDGYEEDLESRIREYIGSLNASFFDIRDSEKKLFSIGDASSSYLKLSLGKKEIARDFEYQETEDPEINARLEVIRKRLLHISDCPVYLDIGKHHRISIVAKDSLKDHLFYGFLLELAFTHHYEDLALAVYAEDMDVISCMYDLPHLFVSGKRLTLNSFRQLQELDQLKTDRPLVLFMYDHCDCIFSNPNIHVIHFSEDVHDLCRDSEAIVEYHNGTSRLYSQQDSEQFSYVCYQADYSRYFAYLGRFNKAFSDDSQRRFSDLFSAERVAYLYKHNDGLLKTEFACCSSEMLSFDLHESRQGPHGLIAGSTGSGKSELIVSMLLSLCLRYPPDYLNIVLIDYKGGGIRESLSFNGQSIPHIIASISNLDSNEFERLIIALNNECLRRQKLFRQLSEASHFSIMSIDEYRSCSYSGKESLANLLIVVDEFAELKKEHPQLIRDLISISRIGRSLGLHLILATQRPSGNIDDEIWSNSRFKLSLKVFEEKDSLDVLRVKDAAYLNEAGSFLLKVDDSIIKARSIYSKYDIEGKDQYEVSILDNTLERIRTCRSKAQGTMTEAGAFCRMIISLTQKMNIRTGRLDFRAPEPCGRKVLTAGRCLVFGEIDDYLNGQKGLLAYDLNENVLICSTRRKEISSLLNTLSEWKRQTVVISHREYRSAYVSDCLNYEDSDDIAFLFDRLPKEDPDLIVIIEDLPAFLSCDDGRLDQICKMIRRSVNQRYSFICLSPSAQLSYRLVNVFRNRIMTGISDPNDLSYFYSMRSRYKGTSFFFKDEPVSFVPAICEELIENGPVLKPFIRRIPEHIQKSADEHGYLLGYDLKERREVMHKERLLICSRDEELLRPYREYKNDLFEICTYAASLAKRNHHAILWLGAGLFSQRLFMPETKNDLNDSQGLLVINGRQILIRSLDNA